MKSPALPSDLVPATACRSSWACCCLKERPEQSGSRCCWKTKDLGRILPKAVLVISLGGPVSAQNLRNLLAVESRKLERKSPLSKTVRRVCSITPCEEVSWITPRAFSSSSPYGTPEGQAVSQARQPRQRSRDLLISSVRSSSPSYKPRIR